MQKGLLVYVICASKLSVRINFHTCIHVCMLLLLLHVMRFSLWLHELKVWTQFLTMAVFTQNVTLQ